MITCPKCNAGYEDSALYCNHCDFDLIEKELTKSKKNKKSLSFTSWWIHFLSFFIGISVLILISYNWLFEGGDFHIGMVIICITFILWGGAYIFNHKIVLLSFSTMPLGLALTWIDESIIEFGRYGPIYLDKEPLNFVIAIAITIVASIIIAIWALRAKKTQYKNEIVNNKDMIPNEYSNENLKIMAKRAGLSDSEIDRALFSAKEETSKELDRILDDIAEEFPMTEEERKEFEKPFRKKLDEM